MKTIIITGATRGLGLAFAERLSKDPYTQLVLAVRDLSAGHELADRLGANTTVEELDMASSASIDAFAARWSKPIHALINNAGLQIHGPVQLSLDGVEQTLAVNHLGVLRLTRALLPHLKHGSVMGIGSGTHNPNDRGATRFGFRGGRFSSIKALAAGETDATTDRQAGLDRYATSKLLSMATTTELARRHQDTKFLTLDPGLMPGTGLARNAPRIVKLAWSFVMPLIVPLMSGASTPEKSAQAGCEILFRNDAQTGCTYDHKASPSKDVWSTVTDPEFGKMIVDQSIEFLDTSKRPTRKVA